MTIHSQDLVRSKIAFARDYNPEGINAFLDLITEDIMSPKQLFITGATGYIGGSVLTQMIKQFPELGITALLRSTTPEFRERYPKVNTVKGDFDSFNVIKSAAHAADIVIHTGDIDHPGCAAAILEGMKSKTTSSFLIHLTGTGCISDEREQSWTGSYNAHKWNDVLEIKEIYELPPSAQHHVIDQNIMDASNDLLKTCIICPPDIFGQNTGVGSRATFLVPEYVKLLLKDKEAFYLGDGENMRAVTHIDDVVELFMILLDNAVQGGGKAQWGREGFYFAVSSEVKWKDAAIAINKLGVEQGWLPKDSKPVSWDAKRVGNTFPDNPGRNLYLWGSNSRADSARAKKLGWKPSAQSFWEALPNDVEIAVRRV